MSKKENKLLALKLTIELELMGNDRSTFGLSTMGVILKSLEW